MALFWLSLAFLVVVTIASSVFVTLRGLAAFRAFKQLSGALGDRLDGISRSSAEIEHHLERAAKSRSALEASLARLSSSRRRLSVLTAAIAGVIHYLFPTAPPRLAGVGLEDTLLALSGIDIGSQTSSALSNPVAAVPSLHAAYALGVGIGVWRFARSHLVRIAGAVYPPLVVLTIVVTGNHFVLDAAAGMLVLGAGFGIASWLQHRAERREFSPDRCYN